MAVASPKMYRFHLKIAYAVNCDITKITGSSLLFQTDFPRVVLIIILSINLIRTSVLIH